MISCHHKIHSKLILNLYIWVGITTLNLVIIKVLATEELTKCYLNNKMHVYGIE